MDNKSAVSALQEHCAQNKIGPLNYDYIDVENGGFICKVTLLDMESFGNGRSKRDAKHLASLHMMRKIQAMSEPDSYNVPSKESSIVDDLMAESVNLNRDMLKELRDYCVRKDMPLPTIEIVQQSGAPNAPEFVACCRLASIIRYGKSDKKKDARQRAAIEMLCVIANDVDNLRDINQQVVNVQTGDGLGDNGLSTIEELEAERRFKFKTYRELSDAGLTEENTGIKLSERHDYFKTYFPHLKDAALQIIHGDEEMSQKSKALAVIDALKLKPRFTKLDCDSMEPLLMMELNCTYDCVIINYETKIYTHILRYFSEMLT